MSTRAVSAPCAHASGEVSPTDCPALNRSSSVGPFSTVHTPHLIPGDDMALHDSPLTPYLTAVLSGDTVVIRPKEQPEKGKPAKEK
jgi:hypothetical protein